MSIHVTSWVLKNSEARLGERLTLLVIADYADESGVAYPSVRTIAHEARLSPRQTQRALRGLESDGRIDSIGVSHLQTITYKIRMEASAEGGDKLSGATFQTH